MTVDYHRGGIDFDAIFDPYVTGTKPAATGYKVAGVDLADRYAPIAFGTKAADVGFRVAGVDVSNLWAAFGTATYFPNSIGANSSTFTGGARSANMQIAIRTNGTIVVSGAGTNTNGFGTSTYGASSAAFDFRISGNIFAARNSAAAVPTLTGKGGVSVSGTTPPGLSTTFDTGWQASADDAANFLNFTTSTPSNGGASQLTGDLTIQIRRKSDGVVVQTMGANFDVLSDSQS